MIARLRPTGRGRVPDRPPPPPTDLVVTPGTTRLDLRWTAPSAVWLAYARLALSDCVSAWGLAGTGSGRLSLDLDSAVPQSYRTGLSMTLAAAGVRGDLVSPPGRAGSRWR